MPISIEDVWAEIQNVKRDLGAVSEQVTLDSATLNNISTIVTNLSTVLTNTNTTTNALVALSEQIITPMSASSIGVALSNTGAAAPASGAVLNTNEAIYVPFAVTSTRTAYKMFCLNGATAAGNLDLAIYNSAGTRLVSIGATAQSGTNVNQTFDIADTSLAPGIYYMAMSTSDATSTHIRYTYNVIPGDYLNEIGRAHV